MGIASVLSRGFRERSPGLPSAAGAFRAAKLQAFAGDTRGSVAIIFGLAIFVLFMMIGVAVDYARFVNARNQTIEATDAAVLAGARALQVNGGNQTAAQNVASIYYQQAIKNRIPVTTDTIQFQVTDNGTAMIAQGNAQISTPFMHLGFIGTNTLATLPLLRSNGADYSKAVLAVGGNGQTNLEVAMMLDITGSMAGQKLTDMKSAASDLVNIVVWQDQSQYTSKIAIVPFAYDVRLPTSGSNPFKLASGNTSTKNPCVVERTGSQKYTDAAPKAGQYVMVHSSSSSSVSPTCNLPVAAEALPLTSDKTSLLTKISGLQTAGSTAGHIGTAWAWYMLSPNWSSLWPNSAAAAYGTPKLKKIAVLMTDGEYNTSYTSMGYAVSETLSGTKVTCKNSANVDCSPAQAVAQCTAMKNAGIEIYTVGFQLGGSQLAINTLSSCATDANHFYNSTTGDALKAAFRDIALKISTLYLSQ